MGLFSNEYACWQNYFEDLPVSPQDVYTKLENGLADRRVPDMRAQRIELLERGALSSKRLYLQIERDGMKYHICAAPFGTGFFVSSRLLFSAWKSWPLLLAVAGGFVFMIPFISGILMAVFGSGLITFFLTFFAFCGMVLLYLVIVVLWLFRCRLTYHRLDSMFAFQEAVHRLLIATVNQVIEAGGRKPLSDEESKPVLHKLLRRKAA
jgi:hypothetical protein